MSRRTPTVIGETLSISAADGEVKVIVVGSAAWREWLGAARCFAFEQDGLRLTAQPRRRGQRRYWYAYARTGAKVRSVYLGRDGEIGLDQLQSALQRLTAGRKNGWSIPVIDTTEAEEFLSGAEARLRDTRRLNAVDSWRLIAFGRALTDQLEAVQEQAAVAFVELDRLRWELRNTAQPLRRRSTDTGELY